METYIEAKCGQCQERLLEDQKARGLCEECWKFSSEDKADVVIDDLLKEVKFSPLLAQLLLTHPQKKIARIKDVRQHTGLNLRHAKMVVDKVNDSIPVFESVETLTELKQLKAQVSANEWSASREDRLGDDLASAHSRLQTEVAEAHRLRLSNQNLEARLGATDRELGEISAELNDLRVKLRAVEKVAGALNIVAKGHVTCSLTGSLLSLVEDAVNGVDDSSF